MYSVIWKKSIPCLLLILAVMLSAFWSALGEEETPMYEARSMVRFYLRPAPGSHEKGEEVPKLTKVIVYERQAEWYRIAYEDHMGWAKAEWLWAFRSLDAARYSAPGYTPETGVLILKETQRITGEDFKGVDVDPGVMLTVHTESDEMYTISVWRGEAVLDRSVGEFSPFVPWQNALPGDLIGGFTTYYHERQGAPLHLERQHNIAFGCELINGTVVEPDEVFSFNAICGPYKKKTGYLMAKNVSQDGTGWGGGICQVTTTLFNAVLGLPLQITAWSTHRYTGVDYVPVSFDAAVGNSKDFQFINSLDYPIRIRALAQSGVVTVLIYRAEEMSVNTGMIKSGYNGE
jgi:hypothetical protein